MYYIKPYSEKVYLIHRCGDRYSYDTMMDAANKLCRYYSPLLGHNFYKQIGDNFRVPHHFIDKKFYDVSWLEDYESKAFDYILRDAYDQVIKVADLYALYKSQFPTYYWRGLDAYDHDRDFRKRPICGTGGGSWGRYYRRPKVTQEKRHVAGDIVDEDIKYHKVKIRKCRNVSNLPNSWDGYCRFNQNNWKKQRKTQWKPKP